MLTMKKCVISPVCTEISFQCKPEELTVPLAQDAFLIMNKLNHPKIQIRTRKTENELFVLAVDPKLEIPVLHSIFQICEDYDIEIFIDFPIEPFEFPTQVYFRPKEESMSYYGIGYNNQIISLDNGAVYDTKNCIVLKQFSDWEDLTEAIAY